MKNLSSEMKIRGGKIKKRIWEKNVVKENFVSELSEFIDREAI